MRRPVVVLGVAALLLSLAGPASAEPPLDVSDQITDRVAALGSGTAAAQGAVTDLAAEDDLRLNAVFVGSFDSADPSDWAQDTAQLSGLAESDVLLAVAVGETTYEYGWWVHEDFPLSEVDVERVITSEVQPRLEAGDRSGAVVALAEQLQSLAETQAEEEAQAAPWSATTTILIVGGVALALLAAHLLSRRRSSAGSSR